MVIVFQCVTVTRLVRSQRCVTSIVGSVCVGLALVGHAVIAVMLDSTDTPTV